MLRRHKADMAVTIDGEARLADDVFVNPDGTRATWVEEIPKVRRRVIFSACAAPGVILTVWSWIEQASNNAAFGQYLVALLPFAFFAWLGYVFSAESLRRKYSVHTVSIPHRERLILASKWIAGGLLCGGFFLWNTFSLHTLGEQWWAPTLATLIFCVPGIYHYLRKRQPVMTPEAIKAKSYYTALTKQLNAAKPAKADVVERTALWVYERTFVRAFGRRGARYVLAVAAFGLAGYLALNGTTKNESTWAVLAAVGGALLAWDALLWLIGAGILIALAIAVFSGMAALPVSVAVIIGALIIASAVSSKK